VRKHYHTCFGNTEDSGTSEKVASCGSCRRGGGLERSRAFAFGRLLRGNLGAVTILGVSGAVLPGAIGLHPALCSGGEQLFCWVSASGLCIVGPRGGGQLRCHNSDGRPRWNRMDRGGPRRRDRRCVVRAALLV